MDFLDFSEKDLVKSFDVLVDIRSWLVDIVEKHHFLLNKLNHLIDMLTVRLDEVLFFFEDDADELFMLLADLDEFFFRLDSEVVGVEILIRALVQCLAWESWWLFLEWRGREHLLEQILRRRDVIGKRVLIELIRWRCRR